MHEDAPWWGSIPDTPLEGPKRTYSAFTAEAVLWKRVAVRMGSECSGLSISP